MPTPDFNQFPIPTLLLDVSLLATFTASLKGVTPASGGGTSNFLRADGSWAVPPGGAPGGSSGQVQINNAGIFGGITNTQLSALINSFTSTLSGAAPASGGGTSNFLRADGTWAAPSGGADPLYLTQGLALDTVNPTFSGNPTDNYAMRVNMITEYRDNDPLFGNANCVQISETAVHGQAHYSAQTQAKATFVALSTNCVYNGSGQKFNLSNSNISYGMSDSAIWGQNYLQYAGGPINGDEGQGWGVFSALIQQQALTTTVITSIPPAATINTTAPNQILKSKDPQSVAVASTVGVAVGDWVVVGQEAPTAGPNMEAVQVTAVGPGNFITGIFMCNHAPGTTITPALRLVVTSSYQMGQDRVLVNMSQPAYTTGLVTGISGGGFIGTGTGWTVNMVGGNALNIGAISLAADNYTGYPFSPGSPLKSWYQITPFADATHIGIYKTTVAGAGNYTGKGPGAGTYEIRPCAKILRIIAPNGVYTGELICETSTSTWAVSDNVECIICPYPDVFGFQYSVGGWTNGGLYRAFMNIVNAGARTFETCFNVGSGFFSTGPTQDAVEWGTVFNLGANANYGITIHHTYLGGIRLSSPYNTGDAPTDIGGSIVWDSGGCRIGPDSDHVALTINANLGGGDSALFEFFTIGHAGNKDSFLSQLKWNGIIYLATYLSAGQDRPGYVLIDRVASQINFERGFLRWNNAGFDATALEVGTEKGAAGVAKDLSLKADGTEMIRLIAGDKIKFSSAPSFSANGTVATVLGSLGPTGAATTVQKWLTFQDNGGVTRYVPCF
jgi:hypothetical protein